MIKVNVVEQCPHTVTATGTLRLSHSILKILAGAVYEQDEWIALLIGTRSTNGLDVTVTDLKVPLQERDYASCELAKPEPLTPEIVGVIHSHHSMGAFFSITDHKTLNTRFPVSLVVAQSRVNSSPVEQLFGFTYLAEGRAVLPCGSPGIVNYTVVPDPVPAEWPTTTVPEFGKPNVSIGLHDCPCATKVRVGLKSHCKTSCGIDTSESITTFFGSDSTSFIAEINSKTQRTKWRQPYNKVNGMVVVDNRPHYDRGPYNMYSGINEGIYEGDDERYLRHWGI